MQKTIKSVIIKKIIIYSLISLVLSLAKTSVMPHFKGVTFGVTPDLLLPFVVALAFFENPETLTVTAAAAGLISDYLGSVGAPLMPIFYLLVAVSTWLLANMRLSHNFIGFFIASFAASAARAICSILFFGIIADGFPVLSLFGKLFFPELFATLIASMILYPLLALIIKKTARNNE